MSAISRTVPFRNIGSEPILDITPHNANEPTEEEVAESYFDTMRDVRRDDVQPLPENSYEAIDYPFRDDDDFSIDVPSYPVTLQLCSLAEIQQYAASHASQPTDNDIKNRNKELLRQLQINDARRQLKRIPQGWESEIDYFRRSYPNAEHFLDLLEEMCALASIGDGVLSMPPLVLDGPPGGGKSVLTEDVARSFSGGYVRISMAGMEMGSELGDADPGWGQTRIGKVFEKLSSGEYANPIFLLDEIDKTAGSERYSPWAALHDLLEPNSAKTFRDRSFDAVAIDASRIIWLATSNEFSVVPAAIADRFTVAHMPLPNNDQLAAVVQSVWQRLQITNPVCAGFTMPDHMHLHLRSDSPRNIGRRLLRACARAAREGVFVLHERHLPPLVANRQRPMGFCP